MYKHLLVPLDATPLAALTVEQAVAYAKSVGARLSFMHARADVGATGDGALLHALSPQSFSEAAAGHARVLLAKAEAAARAAGVEAASMVVTSDTPHLAILDAARSAGCDLVFMASHGRRGVAGAMIGSVTRKLLAHSVLPVLVAAVEGNLAARSHEQRALALLRDEHRSLAAVLHALIERVADATREPDPGLLRAMVFYIQQFPQRLHHPKEDAYLFRKLRQRSSEHDAVLAELEQQHVSGAAQFERLRAALDAGDLAAFRRELNTFAELQWRHMSAEEKIVLPAASRCLSEDDWREIAQAFAPNGDPRFDSGDSFESLANRLLELARQDGP